MSGSNPKYLPIPKKIPYNIRMPKPLLDKLNAYAELTGNTTTDIVIGALTDYMDDKTVFNTYLPDVNGVSLKLPVIADEKIEFINTNLIGRDSASEIYSEITGYSATSETYEILKIPNNLDSFNETFGYITEVQGITAKGKHSGIEFVIIPDVYAYYDNDDVFDALYCVYFDVEMDRLKSVVLIDYMDAINKANDVGNLKLKNKLISCVNELSELKDEISDAEYVDVDEFKNEVVAELRSISEKYNTGNIIPLGANIDGAVVTAELNANPDELNTIIYDNVEIVFNERFSDLDDIIADKVADIVDYRLQNIEKLVRNARSKDEILSAIENNKIKTNK